MTSVASALAVAGGGVNAFTDKGHQSYHFAHEGWFGADTKYGGADKASHFVDYYFLSKELAKLYVFLGHTPGSARWLGVGVSTLTGLVNEIGDGTTQWGFSGEDLAMDFAGALTAALVDVAGAEDLLGFRRGTASFDQSSRYSNEIYVADFRLAGAARRLGLNIGPLKYLLLSLTYGTRGYPGMGIRQPSAGSDSKWASTSSRYWTISTSAAAPGGATASTSWPTTSGSLSPRWDSATT